MKKLPVFANKRRFQVFAQPTAATVEGLRPNLASGDYIVNVIRDHKTAFSEKHEDHYFGRAKSLTEHRTWWLTEIQLTYDGPDPANPEEGKIHYLFRALPANSFDYKLMKRFANRILDAIYEKIGKGEGKIYFSTIPGDKVQEYIDDERIVKYSYDPLQDVSFLDWTVNFVGDELHFVDPATIDVSGRNYAV